MAKKHLRSDMSKEEARFFTTGNVFFGDENGITSLFKIIGRYSELKGTDRATQIQNYMPENDLRFKYENRGITELSSILKRKYGDRSISRKDLKNLSRKWCFSPIVISFDCANIIKTLIEYINQDDILKSACDIYLSRNEYKWERLMTIQHEFLSTRFADQHKDYTIAGRIINDLPAYSLV